MDTRAQGSSLYLVMLMFFMIIIGGAVFAFMLIRSAMGDITGANFNNSFGKGLVFIGFNLFLFITIFIAYAKTRGD